MAKKVFLFISNFFKQGNQRTQNAKKNIAALFLLKGVSVLITMVLVPLTINYINPTKYGIWLTISSFIGWFAFFDVGLGNGLRNKFTESVAKKNFIKARIYVSTTYFILGLIILIVFLIFLFIFPFINWSSVFNTASDLNAELNKLILIVFCFFCIQFILKLITTILIADQKPSISGLVNLLGNLLSFVIIYFLTITTKGNGSLLYLGIVFSASPVLVLILTSIYFFYGKYKIYRPSIKYIKISYAKDIVNLGLQFFIIQIAVFIIFSTDNMIITQLFGPIEVTSYNIAYKYFNIISMLFSIVMSPLWSAYTDAFHKDEIEWIKKATNKMLKLWIILVIIVVLMFFFSKIFYKLWVGEQIKIETTLSALMGLYVIISSWNSIFSNVINGTGKIRLQLYGSIFLTIINIPLCILFAKHMNLGISGVILGTSVTLFPGSIISIIQYNKIINKKAKGIWNK